MSIALILTRMEGIYSRRLTMLLTALVFVLSALCSTLLWKAYGAAIVLSDTSSYLYMARQFLHPSDPLWESARAPGFGYLMSLALLFPSPGLVVFLVQAGVFGLSVALTCLAVTVFTNRPWQGFLVACALLALEVHMMQTFFYSVLLLSESLYVHTLFLGTLLFALGSRGDRRLLYLGCIVLGSSHLIRPMGTAILVFAPALILQGWWRSIPRKAAVWGLGLLLLPAFIWTGRTILTTDEYRGNPFIGLHLTSQTSVLMQPGDILFDDPTTNAAFHEAFERKLPASAAGAYDPFGNIPGTMWWRMLSFYGSLTDTFKQHGPTFTQEQANEYGLEIAVIGKEVAFRAIRLHPGGYLWTVAKSYSRLLNPSLVFRYPPTLFQEEYENRFFFIVQRSWALEEAYTLFYGVDTPLPAVRMHPEISRFLARISIQEEEIVFLQSLRRAPAALVHAILLTCFFLLWRMPSALSQAKREVHSLALLIALLLSLACVQYLLTAAISTVLQARLSIPGSIGIHLALLLSAFGIVKLLSRCRFR